MTGRADETAAGETTGAGAAHTEHSYSGRSVIAAKGVLAVRDRYLWSLFEDWSSAHDQPALPASPESLARFLRSHPAAPATQRRRIAVIDAAHYRHALPPPGRAETVRAALDAARTARLRDLAGRIGDIIGRLPESSWPSALFARRDALILALASTRLSYTEIAAVRVCDVTSSSGAIDALRVETGNGVLTATSQELVSAGVSPSRVYRRWCEVLGHLERYPSNRMLADAIEAGGGPELTGYHRHLDPADERPLLTPIDRWGHTPLSATPLTSRAIADIVRMHLDGRGPGHLQPLLRAKHPTSDLAPEPAPTVVLDHGYYERGILARKNAHDRLGDIDSALADVETRADRLLTNLLEFLQSETDGASTDVLDE